MATTLRSVPGRMVDQFMFHGYADTDGNVRGPFASLEHGFIPDPPPRFWIRFITADDASPMEGCYVGYANRPSPGPYADRGEAEEIAAWLNRECDGRAFYYATDRSPVQP